MERKINLSETDCNAVIEKYYNKKVKLIKFYLEPISNQVNGYMGGHLRLNIQVLNGAKEESLQFFVKTLIADHDVMAEFIKSGNMFNKEISWYTFLDDVKRECGCDISFAPKYYFARENEFIILEDLYNSGCKMQIHLEMKHLKLALISIAKYHAASLAYEEAKSKKLGRKYLLVEDYGEALQEAMYRNEKGYLGYKYIQCGLKALQALVDLLPEKGLTCEEFKQKLTNLVDLAYEESKPSDKFRNVWCNGDLWAKNVMFQHKDEVPIECKIFDFQLQRYNPPAHDVLFMIYESTNNKERQQYFDDYLNFYYEALTDELKRLGIDIEKVLNRDEFDITCKLIMPIIKLTKTIYVSMSAMSPDSFKKISSNPALYAKLTFEDRSNFVVGLFKSEAHYKEIMTTLLEDLRDVVAHEKISIEDCYKILRQLKITEYDFLEYQITPFGGKCGFLGEHSNLKIKLREGYEIKELCFFVKNIPVEEAQRKFVISSGLFFKEMKFYMEFVPKIIDNNITCIEGCIPKCHLARLNDVLVFHDYSINGYITLNSRISYNYETVAIIIKKLAKLHASSLILEEKLSSLTQKYRLGSYEKELIDGFYKDNPQCNEALGSALKGMLTHIDLFPDSKSKISQELFKNRATKAFLRMSEHVKPSQKYRNTICHGDLWSNNILLKFENNTPVDCLFVDFQTTRYNPPAHDLISFLYLATDRKFRSQHLFKVIDLYHQEISKIFIAHGVDVNDVLPYEEFLESCEYWKEFSAVQCVEHFHNIILTSEQIKDLFSDQEYGRKILFEDRSPFIVKTCANDRIYREKMLECITDLREICENSTSLD